jgi:hypothetical protein
MSVRALNLPAYIAKACEIVPADAGRATKQPRYNICPTTNIDAVFEGALGQVMTMTRRSDHW